MVESDSEAKDEYQKNVYIQAKDKLGMDAIFFLESEAGTSFPLIYFYKLEYKNLDTIADYHKKAWNMGQAPLIFIVLPDTVLIYSSYEKPELSSNGKLDPEAGFIEELKLFISSDKEIDNSKNYHSSEILTGTYWDKYSKHFQNKTTVYQVLLDNLGYMREELLESGLSNDTAHALLTCSIFIKYLEDRKDKNGYRVFPKGYFENYLNGAICFTDILSDKNATEKLLNDLNNKFNGDIFAISKDIHSISQKHLNLLRDMLTGQYYLENRQMTLWPLYSFDVIPIELVSNIYQKFVSYESEENKMIYRGSHYTPFHLVTFLMDQVLPWEEDKLKVKILDPSCGSGIFLVEAYKRLISRWKRLNPGKKLSISDLKYILKENVHGVDVNKNALRIAALSLYLTMCEYLEPRYIWNQVKFEAVINRNLFESDFFDENAQFLAKKYDLIVGNPPWGSKLSEKADEYLKKNNKKVGDRQLSQAFLWHVADICEPDGEICMLVSSKNLLFNRSKLNREFRAQFISSFDVKTVLNFSMLRHILFSQVAGPAAAIIFSPKKTCRQNILYCSPKPSYSTLDDWLFIIEPHDIAYIPVEEAIENDIIWKIAMWGSPRDYSIIKKLSKLHTLKDVCEENNWVYSEGYKEGGKDAEKFPVPQFFGKPDIATKTDLKRYTIDISKLKPFTKKELHRYAKTKKEVFNGPHLLIKAGIKKNEGVIATLIEDDVLFRDSILGIHGDLKDLNKLAVCCLCINSNVALYFLALTSRNWLVERDKLQKEELLNLPIPEAIPNLDLIDYIFSNDNSEIEKKNEIVNNLALKLYGLDESEIIQINDTINVTLDYYFNTKSSNAIKQASENVINDYADTFCEMLNKSFYNPKRRFEKKIYLGDDPLRVVSFKLIENSTSINDLDHYGKEFNSAVLSELNKSLQKETSPSVYIRRNLRRYSGDTIFIVKPNQTRFWTKSAALRDADETYRDIMSSPVGFK